MCDIDEDVRNGNEDTNVLCPVFDFSVGVVYFVISVRFYSFP
jgi:hypothetical protein